MPLRLFALLLALAPAAEAPLPELRVEPATGGSVLYVRNGSAQPLTAYVIELVDYPGSYFSYWQDQIEQPILPGGEKRIEVSNMMVGAVPEYVKVRAAIYADGGSAGIPERITMLVERRRAVLETTRELIRRLEKAQSAGTAKDAVAAGLKEWADSLPAAKADRSPQKAINWSAARNLIGGTANRLAGESLEETLAKLRASERLLAASKPAL